MGGIDEVMLQSRDAEVANDFGHTHDREKNEHVLIRKYPRIGTRYVFLLNVKR